MGEDKEYTDHGGPYRFKVLEVGDDGVAARFEIPANNSKMVVRNAKLSRADIYSISPFVKLGEDLVVGEKYVYEPDFLVSLVERKRPNARKKTGSPIDDELGLNSADVFAVYGTDASASGTGINLDGSGGPIELSDSAFVGEEDPLADSKSK